MAGSTPRVALSRLPPERGRGRPPGLLCPGACCCCCCCLHTALGYVAAAAAGPDPVVALEARSGTPGRAAAAGRALAPAERRVLAAFATMALAEAARRTGRLGEAATLGLGEAMRGPVQAAWEELYPGRRPEAITWIRDRLNLLVEEGFLPPESLGHFHRVLGPQAREARPGGPSGPLGQLWRLHQLYLEVAAAAAAGAVAGDGLARVRTQLMRQAARSAAQLGAYEGAAEAGRFSPPVLAEAEALWAAAERAGEVSAATRGTLAGLAGRPTTGPAPAPDASCPICGDRFGATAPVHCAACETAHHPACWTYNGRCATFACGSADTLEAPGTPGATPRFDLAGGPGRDGEAGPEARVARIYWGMNLLALLLAVAFRDFFWVLYWGPALQLGAGVAAAPLVARDPRPGGGAALAQLARFVGAGLAGAFAGGMVVGGCLPGLSR